MIPKKKIVPRKKFYELRPRLRAIAPLTFWISVGFCATNVLIWWLLSHVPVTAIKTFNVPIANTDLAFNLWGYWFLFLAFLMAWSLHVNDWRWLKRALLLGLLSKLIWAFALLFMILNGIAVFATFILWSFLAWVQAWTIVFFSPTINDGVHVVLPENKRLKDAD